jgi:hypothetical protein
MSDSSGHSAPLVSILIINYNGQDHLGACLEALAGDTQSPAFDVIVVDNASPDQSIRLADEKAAQWPALRVVRNAVNRGYAGGVNSALPLARGDFIAVLNPDCQAEPGWLTPLVEFLQTRPNAGAVNPLILLHADGDINAAGQNVHVTGLGFNRRLWQPRALAGQAPMRVSGLQGSAFVLRRALLEQMGGWDESGFLYHEDVELSWTLQLMGYDLYCVPTSVVWHDYHLTMYPEKLFLLERNRLALLTTHLRPRTRLAMAPFILFTEALMWGYCLLRGPAFLRAKAESYRWVSAQAVRLRERRKFINSLRRRADWELLANLRWNYAWDQLLSLGRERGPARRQRVKEVGRLIDNGWPSAKRTNEK